MRRAIVLLCCLIVPALCCLPRWVQSQDKQAGAADPPVLHRLEPGTPEELRNLFKYTGKRIPIVSAHRGGARPGFPENCLETFAGTLQHTAALLEVDPRYTKDGQIVLHHDADLGRTTTGRGRLADFTLAELKKLRLKDPAGEATEFQIPTLDEALQWARGKTVLVLDQKDVPMAARVKKIAEHKAEAYAMVIAYSFEDAKTCYALNPNIMLEIMVPSRDKVAEFDRTGVPWSNVVAFVGHTPPEDAGLYAAIHERGACCLVGTSRNLDRQFSQRQESDRDGLARDYRALLDRGADLIETDIPAALGPLLFK